MGKNGKLKSERLAEIEQWQTFRGEVDTWAFDEIENRLGDLFMKVEHRHDPPPDLESISSDVQDILGIARRRRARMRLYPGRATE
ncbi:hypothetical protein [Nocardia goodfellowii]|uniref:Uncharacterized protein n=1 Tax=Nocardia goodfellowii TaxID=882446 RepID=A0ABS4QFG3_9NOCA|nr:hypothetical protein [Nocardia goodfellowii]MBP2189834.1 hypothetical protein [Nocardia goodfellowii]